MKAISVAIIIGSICNGTAYAQYYGNLTVNPMLPRSRVRLVQSQNAVAVASATPERKLAASLS